MEDDAGAGGGGGGGADGVHSVTPAAVEAVQRRLQQLQGELQRAFDVGDSEASASLAQSITDSTQRLKRLLAALEQQKAMDSAEKVWLSSQLSKVHHIQAVVEDKRRDIHTIQHSILTALTHTHTQPTHSTSSSIFSVFSSSHSTSASTSTSSSAPSVACAALVSRALKLCRECQLTLEQQNLLVDSIDMNEHPATLLHSSPSLTPSPSPSLQSIKAVRKEVVTYIQSQLQHVDAFEQHLVALDHFITFLQRAPRPSYAGGGGGGGAEEGKAAPQPQGGGEGKGSRFSKKPKNARR